MLIIPSYKIVVALVARNTPNITAASDLNECLDGSLAKERNLSTHTMKTNPKAMENDMAPGKILLGRKGTKVDHITCIICIAEIKSNKIKKVEEMGDEARRRRDLRENRKSANSGKVLPKGPNRGR